MKDLARIESIVNALDVKVQFAKAMEYLSEKGIKKPFYDGFYDYKSDLRKEIKGFLSDYSGSDNVIFVLSLDKDKKEFREIDGKRTEIDLPEMQEKPYTEGKTNRVTNFFSVKYLEEIAKELNLELKTFQFGKTIIHLSIFYSVYKNPNQEPVQEEKDLKSTGKSTNSINIKKKNKGD